MSTHFSGGRLALASASGSAKGSCDVVVVGIWARRYFWKITWCSILLYDPGCLLDVQNWEQHNRSQDHVAQCNIEAITTIMFSYGFLTKSFHMFFLVMSCLHNVEPQTALRHQRHHLHQRSQRSQRHQGASQDCF